MDRKVKTLLKGAGLQDLLTGGRVGIQDGPMTAEEIAQQEEYYKQHPEVKAEQEAYIKQAQINSAAESQQRADEQKKRNVENQAARETAEQAYYSWLLSHDRDWLIKHGKIDFNFTDRDPVYQLYQREQEQKGLSDESMIVKGQKDLEEMKKAWTKIQNYKPSRKEEIAFGLPRGTSTIKDLVAAYEKALSVGLNQAQQNYQGNAANYLRLQREIPLLEAQLQNPEQRTAEFAKRRKAYNDAELSRLGLQEGATDEEIAQARYKKGEEGWEWSEKFYERKRRIDEFRAFAYEEKKKYIKEANEMVVKIGDKIKEISDGGGDRIDVEPLLVMLDKLKFGLPVMGQVFRIQEDALNRGMEFADYVKGVNDGTVLNEDGKPMEKIVLWDANAAAEEEHQKRISQFGGMEKFSHFAMNLIYKGLDFVVSKVDQLVPVIGRVMKLGWESFAPYGSANFEAGTATDKLKRFGKKIGNEIVSGALDWGKEKAGELAGQVAESAKGLAGDAASAAKKMLGFGRTRASRRKAMEKLMDDEVELHGGRGQASGFVMRMMAENKKKHKGQYKNPSTNDYGSSMKSFRAFDYGKMENPSKFLTEHFSGDPVPFVSKRAEKKAEDKILASIRAAKMSQAVAKTKMEEARKKIGEKPEYQILYNAFRRYVSV